MRPIAILGSGFGLYGYLPALVACGQSIVLPERYRARFDDRTELHEFDCHLHWAKDELSALQMSSGAVLALCPKMQSQWLATCFDQSQLEVLFLEKPLAPNPATARELQLRLQQSHKVIRIAYLFRFLPWAKEIRACALRNSVSTLKLHWKFQAHHFSNDLATWKREHDQGGGPIRFYGIHVVALLAEFGYSNVEWSSTRMDKQDTVYQWQAVFSGNNLPVMEVDIDTASADTEFSVVGESPAGSFTLIQQSNPIAAENRPNKVGSVDGRVGTLASFCRSAWDDPIRLPEFYSHTIELWNQLEQTGCNFPVQVVA